MDIDIDIEDFFNEEEPLKESEKTEKINRGDVIPTRRKKLGDPNANHEGNQQNLNIRTTNFDAFKTKPTKQQKPDLLSILSSKPVVGSKANHEGNNKSVKKGKRPSF